MAVRIINGDTKKKYPVSHIGGKAQGLAKLKRLEDKLSSYYNYSFRAGIKIPFFFIIPVSYNLNNIDTLLRYADDLETEKFAVRSSSPYEDGIEHSFDGVFDSYLNVDRSGLVEAIESVRASALGNKAKQYSKDFNATIDDKMAVIIQKMIYVEEKGIIYSKFPASIEVTKILTWHQDNESQKDITLIRRELTDKGFPYTIGHKVIEGEGIYKQHADDLSKVSYSIEKKFGYPVRIEYQSDFNNKILYLLQARSIAGIRNIQDITLPELKEGELLVGTTDVNGQGDYTLPAVVICIGREPWNLPYEAVRNLDKKFPDGYILICDHLKFYGLEWDSVTPNKKAVVAGSDLGRDHDLDIAREKGLLYLGTEDFGWEIQAGHIPIKTGDLLRIVSDGTKGLLYRINKYKHN